MGDSTDFFEDLREREAAKAHQPQPIDLEPEPEPSMPAAQDAQPDLEAPLLQDQEPEQHLQQTIHEQERQDQEQPPVLEDAPTPDRNDPLLYVCRVLSIVTAVAAFLCLVVNAISLFRSFDYRGFDYRVSVRLPCSIPSFLSPIRVTQPIKNHAQGSWKERSKDGRLEGLQDCRIVEFYCGF